MKATWSVALCAVLAASLSLPGPTRSSTLAPPYRAERARHDQIRVLAEVLAKSPRMRNHQSRVNDMRADDDRKMASFDLQARSAGGSAAALDGLKRYNDGLQKQVDKIQQYVDR